MCESVFLGEVSSELLCDSEAVSCAMLCELEAVTRRERNRSGRSANAEATVSKRLLHTGRGGESADMNHETPEVRRWTTSIARVQSSGENHGFFYRGLKKKESYWEIMVFFFL